LSWRTLPDLVFRSSSYYEGQDGSFGFQYLLAIPLALAALASIRGRPVAGGCALVALGGGLLVLLTQPNARYLYPALPLITVAFGAALAWFAGRNRWAFGGLIAFVAAATALNAGFLPASSFYHKDFGMPEPFLAADRERYLEDTAPIRAAERYMNRAHPGEPALLTGDSAQADLQGQVYENHWHQISTYDQIRRARNVNDLMRLLERWKVRFVIARVPGAGGPTYPETLAQLLETCAAPEARWNYIYVAQLRRDCRERAALAPPPAPPPTETPALPGWHDDADSGVRYTGRWTHDRAYAEPAYSHTVSYSDVAGDEAGFSFQGSSVTYVFTRAFNRGIAEVLIDGASRGEVDLYAPRIEWRSQREYAGLAPGRHVIAIRVTGEKRPASQGAFVDLDAFIVR
jgi:hypothetical protein